MRSGVPAGAVALAAAIAVSAFLAGCAGTPDEMPPGERPILTEGPGLEPLTSDDPLEFTFDPRGLTGEIGAVEVAAFVAGETGDRPAAGAGREATEGRESTSDREPTSDREAARRWEVTPDSQSPLRITLPLAGLEDGVAYELEFTLVGADGTRAAVANRVPLELALGLPRPVPQEMEIFTLTRRQPLHWHVPVVGGGSADHRDAGDVRDGGTPEGTGGFVSAVPPVSAVLRLSGGLADGSELPVPEAEGPWEPADPLVDRGAFSRREVVAWQVRVVSPGGVLGPWSPEGLLRFDPGRAVPRPRSHTGGGEAVVATPGLSWNSVAGAVRYRVELRAGDGDGDASAVGGDRAGESGGSPQDTAAAATAETATAAATAETTTAETTTAETTTAETGDPRLRLDPGVLETLLNGAETRTLRWRVAAIGPEGVETPFSEYFEFRYVPFMGGLETVVPRDAAVTVVQGSDAAEQADERPAVSVALELPFEMTRYPVTNRVVAALVELEVSAGRMEVSDGLVRTTGDSPRPLIGLETLDFGSQFGLQEQEGRLSVRDGYAAHPAVGLTWYGALAVANALSLLEARDPVYEGLHSGEGEIVIHRERDGYRLPTETEWATAVAAGERIAAGAEVTLREVRQLSPIDLRGINHLRSGDRWEDPRPPFTRSGGPTSPVGSVGPGSPVGISDLLGNVWEWTDDWYDPQWYRRVAGGELESPWTGPAEPVPDVYGRLLRTVRGMAWNTPQEEVRPGNRGGFAPEATSHSIGVRLVRTLR